jgi:hypothetical protein
VDARYLAGRSLNLDVLETLEQHKEPGFHLYCVATGSKQLHQLLGKLQEDTIPGSAQQQYVADCVKMAYMQDDHSEDHCLHRDIANNV